MTEKELLSSSFAREEGDLDFVGVEGGSAFFLWRTSDILRLCLEAIEGLSWNAREVCG